jgi:subtilisin family serine protease/subtilisin-like proprotein convertase family protein
MKFPARGRRQSKPAQNQIARRLGLEALEDRNMLSASPASSVIDLSGLAVNTQQYSSSDILVQFKPSALSGKTIPVLPGTSLGSQLSLVSGLYDIQLKAGTSVSKALAEYSDDLQVLVASPDYTLTSSVYPNDPMFNQQSGLLNTGQGGGTPGDDIGITHAWSVTTGSASTIVALMDTGVDYDQQDLYENIWINQAEIPKSRLAPSLGGTNPNGIQDYYHDGFVSWRDLNDPRNIGPGKITDVNGDGIIDAADILSPMVLNAQGQDTGLGGWAYPGNTQDGDTAHPNDFIGWNFVNNTNNPLDQNGHGTHVAGIIGAAGNNGVGVAGIDWQVSLMPVQFLNSSGEGSISSFIAGLNYAVQHGAKISNNSWSGADDDPLLEAAISNARTNGMIFVAAAGNGGSNNDNTPAYPSSFNLDNIISVAAVDNNNQLASFSNYGQHSVDLAAPGVNILSTLPNNQYGTLSGTSMATPMVTGVVALVWTEHPTWSYLQVINQVLSTVDPVPALQGKLITGGVLDAARAVGYTAPPPPVTTATLQVVSSQSNGTSGNSFSSIQVTFSSAVDPSVLNNTDVALIDPNGQRITIQSFTTVANSGGTQISLNFPTQTTAGTYTLYLAAGIASTSGAALPATYQNTFVLSPVSTFSSNVPVGIPDVSQTFTSLTVPQNLVIGKVTVSINMVNAIDGKIILTLQAPDGTTVLLSNLEGGSGRQFINTTFDDQASTPISGAQAPFTGSFQPDSRLSPLIGKNAQGTWKLFVVDHGTNYYVVLTAWSLTFSTPGGTTSIASVSPTAFGYSVAAPVATASSGSARTVAGALASTASVFSNANLFSVESSSVTAGGPSSTSASSPVGAQRSTNAVDDFFAAFTSVDRLAEVRVMMPHANRSSVSADDALADDNSDDDSADIVAASWMDS